METNERHTKWLPLGTGPPISQSALGIETKQRGSKCTKATKLHDLELRRRARNAVSTSLDQPSEGHSGVRVSLGLIAEVNKNQYDKTLNNGGSSIHRLKKRRQNLHPMHEQCELHQRVAHRDWTGDSLRCSDSCPLCNAHLKPRASTIAVAHGSVARRKN